MSTVPIVNPRMASGLATSRINSSNQALNFRSPPLISIFQFMLPPSTSATSYHLPRTNQDEPSPKPPPLPSYPQPLQSHRPTSGRARSYNPVSRHTSPEFAARVGFSGSGSSWPLSHQ